MAASEALHDARGIAHDLNNLLAAIMNYAELTGAIDAPGSSDDLVQAKADAHEIAVAARRAADLVRELIDVLNEATSEEVDRA